MDLESKKLELFLEMTSVGSVYHSPGRWREYGFAAARAKEFGGRLTDVSCSWEEVEHLARQSYASILMRGSVLQPPMCIDKWVKLVRLGFVRVRTRNQARALIDSVIDKQGQVPF